MLKTQKAYNTSIYEAFSLYILLRTLADHTPELEKELINHDKSDIIFVDAFNFYQKNTRKIEILFDDQMLIRVYFPIPPVCKHLSEQTKDDIMAKITRDSVNEKIQDLCSHKLKERLFDEMEWLSELSRWDFQFNMERFNMLTYLSTFSAYIINFVILLTWTRDIKLN